MIAGIKKYFSGKSSIYGYLFFGLVLIRAWLNAVIPLMDKTEARYAEIARIMSETGNWIVPQIDYGIPFWAKPPLSTWLSAAGISLFGVNEFAIRLPYLLASVFLAVFIGRYAKKNNAPFFLPGLILFCIPEFFLHAGVVSTDVMLAVSVAIVMLSFWEFISKESSKKWGLLFFVGMAIGLLAKGPIVGILCLPPIFIWCVWFKIPFKKIIKTPWLTGLLITVAIAAPWYYLMEINSPGFTDYFFVGEHFKRFFDSGWAGDKYGFPKQQPVGLIWVFLLITTVPWMFMLFWKLAWGFKSIRVDKWRLFLWLWLLWTPLFFTISKSLIHPYILPVMVPIALLVVYEWNQLKRRNFYFVFTLSIPVLMFILLLFPVTKSVFKDNSDKYFLTEKILDAGPVYTLDYKSYSSQFYSKGRVQLINSKQLDSLLQLKQPFSVLIEREAWGSSPPVDLKLLVPVQENKRKGLFIPSYMNKNNTDHQ